jgi:signal transduction histidine kinase
MKVYFRNFLLLRLATVFVVISCLFLFFNIVIDQKISEPWLQFLFIICSSVVSLILFLLLLSYFFRQGLSAILSQLQSALERERRFAGDVAHELRAPLTAMRTYSQIALNTSNAKERKIAMERVINSIDRGARTIQQLLTLSRMPQGVSLEVQERVDLSAEATQMLADHFHVAKKKQIELELVAPAKSVFIAGNSCYIATLLRNLIDNAIAYSQPKSKVKIVIKSSASGVILQAIDSGLGIPKELHERVFEPFYRVNSDSAVLGSGLGLSIVKQIVQIHKGSIELKTPKSGKGLEVKVTFPNYQIDQTTDFLN